MHKEFLVADLGELYSAITFEKLAKHIPACANEKSGIDLMFLNHYLRMNDAMLIRRLNTGWSLQLYCGITLQSGERTKDEDLPSRWSSYLGKKLKDYEQVLKNLKCNLFF